MEKVFDYLANRGTHRSMIGVDRVNGFPDAVTAIKSAAENRFHVEFSVISISNDTDAATNQVLPHDIDSRPYWVLIDLIAPELETEETDDTELRRLVQHDLLRRIASSIMERSVHVDSRFWFGVSADEAEFLPSIVQRLLVRFDPDERLDAKIDTANQRAVVGVGATLALLDFSVLPVPLVVIVGSDRGSQAATKHGVALANQSQSPRRRPPSPTMLSVLSTTAEDDIAAAAAGPVADVQERVFNSDKNIQTLTFSPIFGVSGTLFIQLMRDALKFNLVVHTLDLTGSNAGDVIGACLSSILHSSRHLKRLILRECSLTEVGIAALVPALKESEFVTEIDLSRNPGLGNGALRSLAAVFYEPPPAAVAEGDDTPPVSKVNTSIESLIFSKNNSLCTEEKIWHAEAVEEFFIALGQSKLKKLDLSQCGFIEEDIVLLAQRCLCQMQSLVSLNISDNLFGDAALTWVLAALNPSTIEEIDVRHCGISSLGIRSVAAALDTKEKLARLSLGQNDSMASERQLFTRPTVSEDASGWQASLVPLLAAVDLEEAPIPFLGSKISRSAHSLTTLNLSSMHMTDDDMKFLCREIAESNLLALDISNNYALDESSAQFLKELITMAPNCKLQNINLKENALSLGERIIFGMQLNRTLRVVDLSGMGLIDGIVAPLADISVVNSSLPLERLSVARNQLRADGVASIASMAVGLPTFRAVDLSGMWASFVDAADRPSSLSQTREGGLHFLRPIVLAAKELFRTGRPSFELRLDNNDVSEAVAKFIREQLREAGDGVLRISLAGNPSVPVEWLDEEEHCWLRLQ